MKRRVLYAFLIAAGSILGLYQLLAAKSEEGVLASAGICWLTAAFGAMFEINRFFLYYQAYYDEEYDRLLQENLPMKESLLRQFRYQPDEPDEELTERQKGLKLFLQFFLMTGFFSGLVLVLLSNIFLP